MRLRGVRDRIRASGGKVTYVGYVECGRDIEAHIEAYFDEAVTLSGMEFCDSVTIDYDWDPEHNGVLIEVPV